MANKLAHGGTLCFDEIGELSARMQAALLRVLQEKVIKRYPRASPAGGGPADGTSLRDELKSEERRRILDALDLCQGNRSRTAEHLGMPRRTLAERLREYGVIRKRNA